MVISLTSTGPWASEKTPLLQRTNNHARLFGAKTLIGPGYFSSDADNDFAKRSSKHEYYSSVKNSNRSNDATEIPGASMNSKIWTRKWQNERMEWYSHLCGSLKTIVWINIPFIDVSSDSQKENGRIPGYNRRSSTLSSSSKHVKEDESIPKPWHWSRSLKVHVNNKYL